MGETASSGLEPDISVREHVDSAVCGAGPAGLLSAVMLAQRFPKQTVHVFESIPTPPPSLNDGIAWCDFARFYTLGVFGRGKKALEHFGVWDAVEPYAQELVGTQAWRTNITTNATVNLFADSGREPIYALPLDKLVASLYQHIQDKYATQIHCHLGQSLLPLDFEYPNATEQRNCQATPATTVLLEVNSDDRSRYHMTTNFLIGADGAARSVANRMEEVERQEWKQKTRLESVFAGRPFRVKRFPDTNPRVYKTIPVQIPPDWRQDIGYSASNGDRRFSVVSLPANRDGGLCAVLLLKKDDIFAQADTDPQQLREMLDIHVPVFSKLIDDGVVATVAKKPPSTFPFFRYVGPRLHKGARTVILGDACHSVKPYNGIGVNSAFEDVQILSDILEQEKVFSSGVEDCSLYVGNAAEKFSKARAKDCKAVVELSRAGDRPGRIGFLSYLIPLLMDAFFHKAMPYVFEPPIPGLIHSERYRFHQVAVRKRWERLAQLSILAVALTVLVRAYTYSVRRLASAMGWNQWLVTGAPFLVVCSAALIRRVLNTTK